MCCLNLNEALLPGKSAKWLVLVKDGSSLYYCHKFLVVFNKLLLYSTKLSIDNTTLMTLALSVSVLFLFFAYEVTK